jgi:transposase
MLVIPCIHAVFVDILPSVSWHTAVMVATALPDLDRLDIEALRALVVEQHAQRRQAYSAHLKALSAQSHEIDRLRLIIEKLKRMMFGAKSEKVSIQLEQLELRLEELETAQAAAEASVEATAAEAKSKSRPSRKPLPAHLPREVVTHHPEQDCCPDCGEALRNFGEDVAEILEYIPANFKVIRHVRPKFACTGCERVVEAPAPPRVIERGLAGPGLLAHVLVAKYADHCPLYRQAEIYAREGVDLDRSTMAGWVGASSELLAPLVEALRKHVLSASKIHADDTPVPVLAPGNGKTRTGRLWTYVRDERTAGENTPPAVGSPTHPIARGSIQGNI